MKWLKRNKILKKTSNFDWGIITPDGFDKNENKFIHVFNSEIELKQNRELNKYFIVNKFNYYSNHLPEKAKQKFVMDVRGQHITIGRLRMFKKEVVDLIDNINFEMEFLM